MKVGVITTHIAPAKGYGGPSVSAHVLVDHWSVVADKLILCSSDASEGAAIVREDVTLSGNADIRLYHSYLFRRWGFGLGAINAVSSTCREADAVYVNGVATWPTTLGAWVTILMKKRLVVCPRGGLMPEHLDVIRQGKPTKWWYYRLLVFPALRRAAAIHCTGRSERDSVVNLLGSEDRVFVVANGVFVEDNTGRPVAPCDQLVLCYLGRISPEKGINGFLRNWLRVKRENDRFIVGGGGRGEYFREFNRLVSLSMGAIEYRGYLDAKEARAAIMESQFVVLPSGLEGDVRENFGNIVAESLALSRPVILSKGLEWDQLEHEQCGILFARNSQAVMESIKSAQEIGESEYHAMSDAARKYAKFHLDSMKTTKEVWRRLAGLSV